MALVVAVGFALSVGVARSADQTTQRDDIEAYRREVLAVDPAFTPAAHKAAERRLRAAEAKARAGALDDAALGAALCQVSALADNGHSNCLLETLGQPQVPVFVYPLADGLFVLSADEADADLLGARLLGVDGQTVAEIRRAAQSLAGGLPAYRDVTVSGVYSRPALLHALGLARGPTGATYRFALRDGRTISRGLQAGPPGPRAKGPPTAWAFQDGGKPFRWADAPAHDALIVQVRRNEDAPDLSLNAFLADAERRRASLGRRNVIFDLRSNDGGNMLLTRDAMLAWPASVGPKGRFLVLIGPRTFSAGMATAAYLKQAGGARVTFVGQPPGDRMTFFAENHRVRLPHSGMVISVATERDDFAGGCKAYADCFAGIAQPGARTGSSPEVERVVARVPLEVPNLGPDIAASLHIADWLAGRDPVMASALKAVGSCGDAGACKGELSALAGGE
jgi:hypothetical protein